MIRASQIPPEVVEAAARAITMALVLAVEDDCRACALTDDERTELARASIAAALSAWPNVTTTSWFENSVRKAVLNIPLPQESNNAEG